MQEGVGGRRGTAWVCIHGAIWRDVTQVHVCCCACWQVPEGVSDEEAILLGDILSTAFFCVDQGGVSAGDVVVVLGCGPVGLLAVLAARQRGAAQVCVDWNLTHATAILGLQHMVCWVLHSLLAAVLHDSF